MLTARKAPRACQSCRLQLLSLFENGFTQPASVNAPRLGYNSQSLRFWPSQPRHNVTVRKFTTTSFRAEEPKQDLPKSAEANIESIESIVRQARQTFGETLPKDYLSTEEYVLYERLYGPPLRETRPEDLEYIPGGDQDGAGDNVRNVILKEMENGEFVEIEFDPALGFSVVEDGMSAEHEVDEAELEANEYIPEGEALEAVLAERAESSTAPEDAIEAQGKNQREIDAISRLQRDMEEAMTRPTEEEDDIDEEYEEDMEEEEEQEDYEEDEPDAYLSYDTIRTHPHTMTARSGTNPSTLSLPREHLIKPISELLARADMKHLQEAAEKAFGGKGLPYSSSTPASKKLLPQKHIGLDASQHRMTEIEADAYIAGVMPGTYASVMSTLVEVRKRLGREWIRDLIFREGGEGPRVLDAGASGAGIIAWREILQAEWDVMRDEGIVEGEDAPSGRTTVLTGANSLRHRISKLLDNTTFLPRLPDYIHASNLETHLDGSPEQGRKAFDIIIAPHTLFPLKEDFRRKNMVQNLWSLLDPNGGVLILIEKGLPRGFEAIAGARSLLLDSHISSPGETVFEANIQLSGTERFFPKEEGMIIAPCTNHSKCPMYPIPGLSTGRKDFCHFGQRFIRPKYLQQLLGAKIRNHEDVKYSYVAVRRGVDARKAAIPLMQGEKATLQSFEGYEEYDLPDAEAEIPGEGSDIKFHPLSLPRAILPPLKRRGHVTLDLCTPSGKLERWTVPKSFSQTAYRDARKSKWGDLWALGAKTRILRSPRLGRLGEDGKGKIKGIRDGRMGKGGKKKKKSQFDDEGGPHGRRTKGGRIWKQAEPMEEDDL
jgi:ribosomal protein RSM22 (predicted rRNA methylase)